MRIACKKCQKMVDEIRTHRDPDTGSTTIEVSCHGETDNMTVTEEWIRSDQEFAMLIESGMVIGWAFDDDRPEE